LTRVIYDQNLAKEYHAEVPMTPPEQPSGNHTLGRRERKKQEIRRKIFRAAFELFLEKGFENTTVEEIAERADVGKGTVFNYFPRKTTLLPALADDWMTLLTEELGPVDEWKGTTREKLERVFHFLTDLSVQNPELARLALFESLRHMQAPTAIASEPGVREFLAVTRSVLHQGQGSGEVRPDLDTEYAANLIESAFHRTLVLWLRDRGPVELLHREISAKLDIIFEGLTPKSKTHAGSGSCKRSTKPRGTTR